MLFLLISCEWDDEFIRKIDIKINTNNKNGKSFMFVGIENRIEQVIANLLDNAISFSENNKKIFV